MVTEINRCYGASRMRIGPLIRGTANMTMVSGVPAGGPPLSDQTPEGLSNFAGGIGNMTSATGEERKLSDAEVAERNRARRANKIYRQVCSEKGLELCFFHNFSVWSDYVNGKMSDSEFYERSESAAREMAENVNEQ